MTSKTRCSASTPRRASTRMRVDPVMGYTAARKIPDRWVPTTCGYCSVGCGMFIGVKDGRAVSVRGNPDHPGQQRQRSVRRGSRSTRPSTRRTARVTRCFAARASGPARTRVTLGRGASRRWRAGFARSRQAHGPEAVGVISTGQLVTEEFYTLGKLVQLGLGTPHYDGNTTLCMSTAVAGYKRSFGSDGPPGAYEDLEQRRRHPAHRRQHRRQPSDSVAAAGGQSRARR